MNIEIFENPELVALLSKMNKNESHTLDDTEKILLDMYGKGIYVTNMFFKQLNDNWLEKKDHSGDTKIYLNFDFKNLTNEVVLNHMSAVFKHPNHPELLHMTYQFGEVETPVECSKVLIH